MAAISCFAIVLAAGRALLVVHANHAGHARVARGCGAHRICCARRAFPAAPLCLFAHAHCWAALPVTAIALGLKAVGVFGCKPTAVTVSTGLTLGVGSIRAPWAVNIHAAGLNVPAHHALHVFGSVQHVSVHRNAVGIHRPASGP